MEIFTELLGQYVFPVVMCLLMFWYIKEQNDSHRSEVESLEKSFSASLEKVTSALSELTIAVREMRAANQRMND